MLAYERTYGACVWGAVARATLEQNPSVFRNPLLSESAPAKLGVYLTYAVAWLAPEYSSYAAVRAVQLYSNTTVLDLDLVYMYYQYM